MSEIPSGWTIFGVTALVVASNAIWALIIWRVNSRCQSQVRDAMKVVLVMAQTPQTSQYVQPSGASVASQMEDTDRAQVEVESQTNHAARRTTMRAAT